MGDRELDQGLEPGSRIDSRLEYVRGLIEGAELSPDERRDRSVAELAAAVAELAAGLRDVRGEVSRMRPSRAELSARGGSRPECLFCPICASKIPLPEPEDGPAPAEVGCPSCGAVLELG